MDMATATANKATQTPALATFELDEEQLRLISPRGGRVAAPSVYLNEVKQAIANPGKAYGLPVTGTVKGAYILGQLRKAEKQLAESKEFPEGGTLKKWNREDSLPRGFVGFQFVPAEQSTEQGSGS